MVLLGHRRPCEEHGRDGRQPDEAISAPGDFAPVNFAPSDFATCFFSLAAFAALTGDGDRGFGSERLLKGRNSHPLISFSTSCHATSVWKGFPFAHVERHRVAIAIV